MEHRLSPRTRVKICGITRTDDALTAAALGVDAIGLVFYQPSPRHLEIEQAVSICRQLPAFVTTVALFLNADEAYVTEVVTRVPVDLLQFHGTEDPAYCERFTKPYIKALGMGSLSHQDLIAQANAFINARGLLLDSHIQGAAGGSGEVFDWSSVPGQLNKPVILAGGLTVGNVAEAISRVHPWAVDVSSGVEADKGVKNAELMSAFMKEVDNASQ
jgi:phosphoribosylanthranilate isomerase